MRKYWLELSALTLIAAILVIDLSPAWTWMNTDSDGAHYTMAAKYLTTAHHMSAPLYLLLGHLILKLPLGTEAWRMGLMSIIGTIGACVFIYLIVRKLLADNKNARYYAIISSIIYGGSALVLSQSIIIETYTLATMCGVGAYYFVLKKKWIWASVFLGAGLAIHPFLAFVVWLVLYIANKQLRNWRYSLVTISFFLFYLYIPIVGALNPGDNMWGNTTSGGFFEGTLGMVFMLTGGLSVWDFPKRLLDTCGILLVSFGLGVVPLVWYFLKGRSWRNHLLWLVLVPVIYFTINLAAETYVYMIVGVAFGSIVIGLSLSKMHARWTLAVLCVAMLLVLGNALYFDIGRTLDPEMSAMKFYHELDKIPDGDKFLGGGWTWAMVYVYNKEENRNIIPISQDALPSDEYLSILDDMNVKYRPSDAKSYISKEGEIAISIAELNDGVWIAKETKPEVYQYEIVPAKGNEDYIGRWIGQEVKPKWEWKPSNPYKFISGQLEVAEWHHVLWVRSPSGLGQMLFVIVFGIYGYGVFFVLKRLWSRRKEGE